MTLNQVSAYILKFASLYLNHILAYILDPTSTLNLNLISAYTLKLVPIPVLSQVLAYKANTMQLIENRYLLEKYKYQQIQAIYM